MRARMMSIDVLSVSAEMPTLGRCSDMAKLGAAEAWDRAPEVRAPRQRDGRVALPDTRARASETERQSESELVVEAARHYKRPETWWTWVVGSNLAALWDGGGLHRRVGTGGGWPGGPCDCLSDGLQRYSRLPTRSNGSR